MDDVNDFSVTAEMMINFIITLLEAVKHDPLCSALFKKYKKICQIFSTMKERMPIVRGRSTLDGAENAPLVNTLWLRGYMLLSWIILTGFASERFPVSGH